MKKFSLILAAVLAFGTSSVFASSNAPVIKSYTHSFHNEQGVDNWYYVEFGSTESLMTWSESNNRFVGKDTSANVTTADFNTGINSDTGLKFVAPFKGMVRIKCTFEQPYADSNKGDGIKAMVYKGTRLLWSGSVKYGSPQSCELYTSVRKLDEIKFVINRGGTNYYDWAWIKPTIEYLGEDYSDSDSDGGYFQRTNGELKEMNFSEEKELYMASDGLAFIGQDKVMPTKKCSVVKRFTATEQGRYRVLCMIYSEDMRSGGVVVKVYKNGEQFWEQLCIDDEDAVVDVRAFANVGDTIDVEVCANEFDGYNAVDWSCDISKFVGTLWSDEISSQGYTFTKGKSETLSSCIASAGGADGVQVYTIFNDLKIPMQQSGGKWTSTIEDYDGYASMSEIYPADGGDVAVDIPIKENKTVYIGGKFEVNSSSDGVVIKLLHNGKLVWSNRVGGERAVRWDEPYDISYFKNDMSVLLNVKEGDILTFVFDQWRTSKSDVIDISDISIDAIIGQPMSRTTQWKLKNSIVIDTNAQKVMKNGEKSSCKTVIKDGTTYVSEDAVDFENASEFITIDGEKLIPVRKTAENLGYNVSYIADGIVVIYKNLPQFIGFSEISEINSAVKGGVFFE